MLLTTHWQSSHLSAQISQTQGCSQISLTLKIPSVNLVICYQAVIFWQVWEGSSGGQVCFQNEFKMIRFKSADCAMVNEGIVLHNMALRKIDLILQQLEQLQTELSSDNLKKFISKAQLRFSSIRYYKSNEGLTYVINCSFLNAKISLMQKHNKCKNVYNVKI